MVRPAVENVGVVGGGRHDAAAPIAPLDQSPSANVQVTSARAGGEDKSKRHCGKAQGPDDRPRRNLASH